MIGVMNGWKGQPGHGNGWYGAGVLGGGEAGGGIQGNIGAGSSWASLFSNALIRASSCATWISREKIR